MKKFLFYILFISLNIVFQKPAMARLERNIELVADDCRVVRTAFYISDIGTRARVSDIDICKKKIIVVKKDQFIPLQISLEAKESSDDKVITQGIIYQIMDDIENLVKNLDIDCKATKCVGVATGVIAKGAVNNNSIYDFAKSKLNIHLKSIPVTEEPKLGFLGILGNRYIAEKKSNNLVVLDIRNYNFQISNTLSGTLDSINFNYGPEAFTTDILESVKGFKDPRNEKITSLNTKEVGFALKIAQSKLEEKVAENPAMIQYFKGNGIVYGMGDVLDNLATNLVPLIDGSFGKVDVLNSLTNITDINTQDLVQQYPNLRNRLDYIFSDLLFVYSIMGLLKIEKINILKQSPDIDGLLVDDRFWN